MEQQPRTGPGRCVYLEVQHVGWCYIYTGVKQMWVNSNICDTCVSGVAPDMDPGYLHEQEQIESLERINSICETNESFDSCSSCNPSRLRELHESKLPFVSPIKFFH